MQRTESPAADHSFRPDIEGLRALAVLGVLFFHADLFGMDGGYVGVDVFFVVSGFLITRLLLNEVARSGTISLPQFWARRARRLLPASTLVLVATLLAARFMLDPISQGFTNRSGVAASAFGANLLFWSRGGYTGLTLPEPLLHYWSLAVEEQFYLFWPVILFGLTRLGGHIRRLAASVTLAIGAASFLLCVGLSNSRQSFAFYWLPTRAWELLIGAGIAIAGARVTRWNQQVRATAAWLGLGLIGLCFFTFDDPTVSHFPGIRAAVPVIATAMVIIGAPTFGGPGQILSAAPLQWIGKHSYAIYLWHFPLLVLPAAKWGPLSTGQRVALLAVSAGLAALSFRYVEDPIRQHRVLAARPSRSLRLGAGLAAASAVTGLLLIGAAPSLTGGAAATTPTLAGDDAGVTEVVAMETTVAEVVVDSALDTQDSTAVTEATTAETDTTVDNEGRPYPANPARVRKLEAANADLINRAVDNNEVPSNLTPTLEEVYNDKPTVYDDGCILGDNQTDPDGCVYGSTGSGTTVVLYGDSHAAQWFPAFESVARKRGWKLVVMTKMACPTGDVAQEDSAQTKECRVWRSKVVERLAQLKPELVVMSSFRYKGTTARQWKKALDASMSEVRPLAKRVLILGDTPTPKGDVPSCVSGSLRRVGRCNTERSKAVRDSWLAVDAEVAEAHDAVLVTTGDWLCSRSTCPVVVGNVLLYRDESHLTTAGAKFLAPYIDAALRSVLS